MSQDNPPYFPYPIRGFSIFAIFLIIGTPIQTIVQTFFAHQWVLGPDTLIEISNMFVEEVIPAILPGFSLNMPAPFIAGVLAALVTARGYGLSLNNAIIRTIIAGIITDMIIATFVIMDGTQISLHLIGLWLIVAVVQGILSGALCWRIGKRFKLDRPVEM